MEMSLVHLVGEKRGGEVAFSMSLAWHGDHQSFCCLDLLSQQAVFPIRGQIKWRLTLTEQNEKSVK